MAARGSTRELGHRLPSERERGAANNLRRILAGPATADRDQALTLLDQSGRKADIVLTPPMARLLVELLGYLGRGDGVTLVPVSQMLTTQQAADILNVSRPFLISLLEQNRLPYTLVGRHRRIKAEELFAYQRRRDQGRADALAELAAVDSDLLWRMFANRFTVLLDACVLVPALKRNCLLSLAEAGFFRVRWSASILEETERAIVERLHQGGPAVSWQKAARVRQAMQTAFEDAMVTGYERLVEAVPALPDPNDAHVVAAAMKARAAVIVTDNIRHFPDRILGALDLEAKTADEFLADTVDLDTGRAVAAIRVMRERFRRPDLAAGDLLLKMQAAGLPQTTDILREHAHSL